MNVQEKLIRREIDRVTQFKGGMVVAHSYNTGLYTVQNGPGSVVDDMQILGDSNVQTGNTALFVHPGDGGIPVIIGQFPGVTG